MLKELLIAILLGALLGFGATGTYFAITHEKPDTSQEVTQEQVQDENNSDTNTIEDTSDTSLSTTSQSVVILSPETETYTDKSSITIKGNSVANSAIIAVTPLDTYQTVASDTGSFELDVDLEAGVNLITVNSIDPQNNQSQAEIIITYSTAKI